MSKTIFLLAMTLRLIMKKAFSAIDLLIGLLVITAVIMLLFKTFYSVEPLNTVTPDVIQEHVDKTVNEIEQMRQETIDYNTKINNEL